MSGLPALFITSGVNPAFRMIFLAWRNACAMPMSDDQTCGSRLRPIPVSELRSALTGARAAECEVAAALRKIDGCMHLVVAAESYEGAALLGQIRSQKQISEIPF